MAAPVDPLETIVRAEVGERVGDLVREIVRRIVADVAREEFDRIAAAVNGGPAPASTATGAAGAGLDSPRRERAAPRRCRRCGETKPPSDFEAGRRQCRACRRKAARRNYHARAAAGEAGPGSDPPG